MFEEKYIGCVCNVQDLRNLNDRLNEMVLSQINDAQELVMLNSFAHECNEYLFKRSLEERISAVESWRWVLEDLSKRLDNEIVALQHEDEALKVIIHRLQDEIVRCSKDLKTPCIMMQCIDRVEEAIREENKFLREHKKMFEAMLVELNKQIKYLLNTKKCMQNDILKKQEAISVDEACGNIHLETLENRQHRRKIRGSPLSRWEGKCASLKAAGLCALSSAIITRQQIRGSRVQLSVAGQSYSARVEAALRKRLHSNVIKLEELGWQKDEALRDIKSLEEELTNTEQTLLNNMDHVRLIDARLQDRNLRPGIEKTRDNVEKKLKTEQARLRHFTKHLRRNVDRITSLKNRLLDAVSRFDFCAEDLIQVIQLDQERLNNRLCICEDIPQSSPEPAPSTNREPGHTLPSIREEDEEAIEEEEDEEVDDYPLDF